jgi:hypothetical protein
VPRALTFRPGYALAALAIFAIEVAIALFVRDAFVRPYLGDTLAVILVYAGLRAVLRIGVIGVTAAALVIAFAIEFGQRFGLLDLLGLRDVPLARIALGSGFDPRDLAAYTIGAVLVLLFEKFRPRR